MVIQYANHSQGSEDLAVLEKKKAELTFKENILTGETNENLSDYMCHNCH